MSLTRDGHLSDLALERVLAGERVDEAAAHASGCELCARRIESARAMPLDVRPPARGHPGGGGGAARVHPAPG